VALHLTTKDTKSTKESENVAVDAILPRCRSSSMEQPITRFDTSLNSIFMLFVSFVVVLISLICDQRSE